MVSTVDIKRGWLSNRSRRLIFLCVVAALIIGVIVFVYYRTTHQPGVADAPDLNAANPLGASAIDSNSADSTINPTVITGTIEKIDGDHLTLKNDTETWQIQLLKDAVIQSDSGNATDGPKIETKDRAALKKGQVISVTVTQITPGIELPAMAVIIPSTN